MKKTEQIVKETQDQLRDNFFGGVDDPLACARKSIVYTDTAFEILTEGGGLSELEDLEEEVEELLEWSDHKK